jgi:hypothetical protein
MKRRLCIIFALCTLLIWSEVNAEPLVNFYQRPNNEHLFSTAKILQRYLPAAIHQVINPYKINCATPFFQTKKPDPSKSKKSKRGPTPVPPPRPGPTPPKTFYKIGEFAQGGVVIWVTEDKQHGLVASIVNNSTEAQWGPADQTTNATNNQRLPAFYINPIPKENYGGYKNQKIIQELKNWETNYPAFHIASEYKIRIGNIEYDDWFLPTSTELQRIYTLRAIVSAVSIANGGQRLLVDDTNGFYWSSREYVAGEAWDLDFSSNVQEGRSKNAAEAVRCVRAF